MGSVALCVDVSGREEAPGVPTAELPPIFKHKSSLGIIASVTTQRSNRVIETMAVDSCIDCLLEDREVLPSPQPSLGVVSYRRFVKKMDTRHKQYRGTNSVYCSWKGYSWPVSPPEYTRQPCGLRS